MHSLAPQAPRAVGLVAGRDALTLLLDRRSFRAEVARCRNGGAVVLIEIDAVRPAEDAHRREQMDRLLRAVASALLCRLRSGDVAGHLGAASLGVLLRRVPAGETERIAHALRASLGAVIEDELPGACRCGLSVRFTSLGAGTEPDALVVPAGA